MAIRIPLVVSKQVPQNTNVAKFILSTEKLRGLVEFDNGLVQVVFEPTPGVIQQVIVENSFDEIASAVQDDDYSKFEGFNLFD